MTNVSISAETQKLLERRLKSGEYRTVDDVLHAALEALDTINSVALDEATLDAIDRSEGQIERGEVHEWESVREQVREGFPTERG